jgi:hypothetical protein
MRKTTGGHSRRRVAGLTSLECSGVGSGLGRAAGSVSSQHRAFPRIMPGGFVVLWTIVRIEGEF